MEKRQQGLGTVVLPELASASWKDVVEISGSRGLTALRDKLRELDAPALADAAVLKRIHKEFLDELDRQRPRWWRPGASGALIAIGAIPIVGQVAGTVAGVAQTAMEVGQVWHGKRSWTATLIRARRQLRRDRP